MPATAARCTRVPASRRAAIRTSAGVRTLTTTAWARTALDDHHDGQTVSRTVGWALETAAPPRALRTPPCVAAGVLPGGYMALKADDSWRACCRAAAMA